MYSASNSSQLPVGAIPYGAEYLQAARKYGFDPYSGSISSFNPATSASLTAALHRSKQKAKAKQQATAARPEAQPRQEEEHDIGDGLEENCFALVSTEELEKQGLRPHPDKIAEAAALSSVSLPVGSYKMCLPAQVIQGHISALQFQAVRLACQKHETFLPDGSRAGFFLGDGPGVGKGRQIASLVFENILRGRTKAIWFSASGDLALDAQRDFHDIGALRYEPVVLHDLKHCKAKPGDKLADTAGYDRGILFSTYDLLIAGKTKAPKPKPGYCHVHADHEDAADCGLGDLCEPAEIDPAHSEFGEGSRLQQMVDWLGGEGFDGALVFDECHRAKNCIAKQAAMGRKQNESKTSRAVVEIQRRLPNARVLYVSATGATEAENLCYMTRLGLWGDKTAFRDKLEFVNMLQQRGVAAMELVAMELKQSGSFIARTLSYEGVEFDQINVNIPDEYKQMYDAAAAIWLQVKEAIDDCKESGLIDPHQKKLISGQYYSAQLRFFRQLCTAAKVDTVSKLAQKMLDEGKCVVIGLQSTGEARTEAMVAAKEKATGADDNDFDSFVEPASLILSTVIKFMPASYPDRARLLEKAENMKLPGNPLDELIERLGGVDAVAEMSGRKRRMVKQPNGVYKYCLRSGRDIHLDKVNIHEKDEFQNGNKLVAVISDAASTGISLQADRSKPNQRQRVHITLELAWSADKTVQQLGRTHRSNQLQPPKYLIVSTDISGEHRFASAVACRLQQLGALTHGDRHAASAADALNNFNLQNKWATAALRKMYKILLGQMEPPDDVTPDFIQEGMSEVGSTAQQALERLRLLRAFIPDAKDALEEVDVLKKETLTEMDKQMGRKEALPGGNINKLLNRLLGCQVDIQSQIFSYFTALQDAEIKLAKANGTYDDCGIIKPHGESIAFRKKEIIYQDDYSGMCTYHAEFQIDRGMNYDAAVKVLEQERKEDPDTQCGFFRQVVDHNQRTYYVLALPRDAQGRKLKTQRSRNGRIKSRAAYYRIVRPAAGFSSDDMSSDKFHHIYTTIKESASLKVHWNEELKADSQKNRRQSLQLITGSILQILPTIAGQLRTHKLQVMRVESTDGKHQEIGLYLNNKDGAKVLDKVRSLQPYKPWQFKTMGTGQDGTAANLLGGVQPAPGGAMGLSQSQMNGAAPRPELASGILDLSSSPDASPVKAASKGGDKENRPRVARAKGEKRAKRTSKASAAASTTDLVDVQVAEPEHMLAAGLWEDIALPALKKAEAKKAAAEAKKPARKAEPLCMSDADTEPSDDEEAERDSIFDSASDSEAADKSSKPASKPTRAARACSKKATKAIAAACVDLDTDGSDEESAHETDSEAETDANESPSAAGRAALLKKQSRGGSASPASAEPDSGAGSPKQLQQQGSGSSIPEGSAREPSTAAAKNRSASRAKTSLALSSDDSEQPEDQRAKFAAVESDEDAESPVAVMLKSRKLSKVGDSSAERGRSASTDWETLRSNSAVSEGWQVKCKCGVTVDDGKPMAECDGGCKTWVHIQCHKIKAGADFYCDQCTEGVQTSKSRTQQDDPVSEPMADSDAEDNDHVENGAGPGGYGPEEEAVPALMSRKSKAAPRSPTPDAAAGAADRRPDTGAEKTSVNCKEPAGAAAKDPEGIPSGKKKNKKGKLGVTEGRVTKGGKRGRMSLKALALSSAEARSPNASPDASDTGILSHQEAKADNGPSLRLEAGNSPSPRAQLGADLIANRSDLENSHSPIAAKESAAASLSDGEEGATAGATHSDAFPRSVSPVPVTHATPSKRPKRLAIPQSNASAPETCPSEATPSKATPSKVAPSKATPSKVTPSKRGREAAGGSPGWVAEHAAGVEAAVQGGTPGKRRRSLLPPAMLNLGPVQASTSRDDVASEAAKWRSRCAELEAAAAKVKVMEQERASREAAGEADLRRSIEASLAERVKEEKLKLSRKALELGKQKGMQEAENKSQAQLQALRAEKQAAAEQLKAAQSDMATAKQRLHTVSADKQAATQELHTVQVQMQAVKQRLAASDADKAAAAEQLADSKAAHEEERARWQQQQKQWQAERAAKSEKEEQLQRDMAAMQAMLAEYKAALAAAQAADKQASLEGITRSTGARAVPMTPHTPGHMEGADEAQGGVDRGLPACTPAKTVLEFDAASESAARAANSKQVKGVSDSGKKRVSWAPLPMVQDENCDEAEEAEVVSTPVTREAVLTWLEGVTTASLEDITEGLTAKQQMPALSDILQELQSDFEIATKAGRYFML